MRSSSARPDVHIYCAAAAHQRARTPAHHSHRSLAARMAAQPFDLNTGVVTDDVRTRDFFEAVGIELHKSEQCEQLTQFLLDNCAAVNVGILKKTCTAVTFNEGMSKCGLALGFKVCVESFLGFQFKVADADKKGRSKAGVGGTKEKRFCKNRPSLSVELGEAGVAAIRLKPSFFYAELGKVDPQRCYLKSTQVQYSFESEPC